MRHPGPFRLYPEERHWWSMNDYGAVLGAMLELKPARVLEFGPGSSTLALIEGGASHIDTLEDNGDWAKVYRERLERKYPGVVHVHEYVWADPLTVPAIDGETYDMALVDGPRGMDRRHAVIEFCLDRCRAVLVPTEDLIGSFRVGLIAIGEARGWNVTIEDTGPHSGGFALFTQPAEPVEVPAAQAPGEHSEQPAALPADPRAFDVDEPARPELQTPEDAQPEQLETPTAPELRTRASRAKAPTKPRQRRAKPPTV
jgi:hypothetical protein